MKDWVLASASLTSNFPLFIQLTNHNREWLEEKGLKSNCQLSFIFTKSEIDERSIVLLKVLGLWRDFQD